MVQEAERANLLRASYEPRDGRRSVYKMKPVDLASVATICDCWKIMYRR